MTLLKERFSNYKRTGIFPVLLLFAGVFLFSAPIDALAADRVWGGGSEVPGTVNNNWSRAVHWTGDTVPGIGDTVTFNATSVQNCTIDSVGAANSHANQLGGLTVASTYTGIITQSVQVYSSTVDLNLSNCTWTANAAMEPEGFTISGGTFTTAQAIWNWGNIACSGNGTINQTAAYTVEQGQTAKTVTNTGTGTISFYKFEDNSDTSAVATAKTTVSCDISVGADGMYTNNWNAAGDGYFIIDTGVTVTVSGGYYNKGKTETKSGSFVKVAGDIELDRFDAGVAQNQAWGFDTTNGGTFEWTGSTADQHVWPNSNSSYSKFYDFKKSGANILYIEKYPLYTLNDFTVTAGTCVESSGMYIGDAAGDDIIVTTGGRLEAKKFMTVTGNITLEDDNTLFWGTGDGYPTVVEFGGTFSCEAGTTAKFQAEWCTDEAGGTKYFKLVGTAGAIRSFTGSNSQFVQTPSLGVCHVYLDNIYLDLTDTLTRIADQKITLAGNSQFDAITLNGDADTLFETGAFTATVGGAFLNTFGTVTITAGGAINAGANAFTSDTANSTVATSGALTCGDLTITGGTFTNTATNTISSSGNVVISVFGATTTNNTLTMTGNGKYINASVDLGNLINNGGTDGSRNYISTNNLTLDGTFTNNSGKYFTTLDGANSRNLTTGDAGTNGTIDIDGPFYANASTITIQDATTGNFDVDTQSDFSYDTSTVDLKGTGTITGHTNWISFYNLTCGYPGKTTSINMGAAWNGIDIYNALIVGTGSLSQSVTQQKLLLYGATVTNGGTIDVEEFECNVGTSSIDGGNFADSTMQVVNGGTLGLTGNVTASGNWKVGYYTDNKTNVLNLAGNSITSSGYFDVGEWDPTKPACVGQVTCGAGSINLGSDMHVYSRINGADTTSINFGSGTHTIPDEFHITGANASATLSSVTTSVGGDFTNEGTLNAGGGTLILYGATTPTTFTPSGSETFNNLTIDKTNATDTINTATNALAIGGALDIQDGTLNLATTTTVTGAVSVGNGAGAASTLKSTTASLQANFNDDVTIASDGTFSFQAATMALKFDNEAGDLVDIAAGGSFVVKGTAGNLTTLSNDSGTDKWHIHNGNAQDQSANLAYITPSYSDASGGTNPIQPATTATDGGNNINWVFGDGDAISGTVYQDQGTTIITENCPIVMYLYYATGSTLTQTATAVAGVGTYSFTGLNLSAGDVATIYIHDQASGWEGCTTYRSDADGAADVNVYKDHVIIHSDSGSLTNTNMSNADDGDTDIKYNVAAGVLTVEDNFEAYIFGGTFQPGGGVIVDDININNGTFTMEANAVTVSGTWITGASGAFSGTGAGTVTFDSAAAEQITSHGESFNAVTFNNVAGTGTWTLQDATVFNSTLTITKGTLIDGGQTITCKGDFTNSDKFTATGTFIFDVTGGTFVTLTTNGTTATQDFNIFQVSGDTNGRVTLKAGDSLKVNGTFTVATATEFNTSTTDASNVEIGGNVDINGTYAQANSGTTTITGAGTEWDSTGGDYYYDSAGGKTPTLIFNTTGTSNFKAVTDESFYSVTHQGAGDIVLDTSTADGSININGVFTKSAGSGDFGDGAGDNHNISLINAGATTTPFVFTAGTVSFNRFMFKGNTANTVIPAGTYATGDVTLEPSADTTFVLGGNVTFDQAAAGNCELKIFGGVNNIRATLDTTGANFSIDADAIEMGYAAGGGAADDYWGTLKCNDSAVTIAGNLTYNTPGSIIDADTSAITVGDDFNNTAAGTFTYDTSTFEFNDATKTSNILGSMTFYNFKCTTADKAIVFPNTPAIQTIAAGGTLDLNGPAAGDEVKLDSTTPGTHWDINCTAAQTVTFVSVIDSDASFGAAITANNSINRGNNDNWTFGAVTRYWVAAADGDWDTNANWSSASGGAGGADYPQAGDTAVFDNGSAANCTLDAAVNIAELQMKGAPTAYAGTLSCGANGFTASGAMTVTSGIFTVGANTTTVGGTLTIDGGTATFTNATLIDCNGAVALSAGTLTAPNNTMNVAGNWTISGTGAFTCGTGTVKFDGAAGQTVRSNSKTYNKITVTNAAAAGTTFREAFTAASFEDTTASTNLYFKEALTYTITGAAGSLNIHGQAAGTKITIDSEGGAQFTLDFTGAAQQINFVDLSDCKAGTNAGTAYNSTNTTPLTNENWTFSALAITTPTAGSTINQQPTIIGTATPGDNVVIKGTVGAVAFQQVATAVADAAGNYRVRQANYTGTLDVGANNIRCDVGANQGAAVAVTVSAAPTTDQTPTVTSPADGGTVNGSTPTISGKGLAGQAVALWASDANGNLLLTNVANTVVTAAGDWTIASGDYNTPLVKGINYLSVTVNGVASNITSVTFTDPFGVVFDSVTNNPIANATVSIFTQAGVLCRPGIEIARSDANPQKTGADGAYSFLTINGNFYITVSADGYTYPSAMASFPAGRVIVNGSRGEVFAVAGVIIQMDHPMDGSDMLLKIKKTANKKEAVIGDVVTYTVTIKNISSSTVSGIYLADQIPGGFKYIKGKAILDNVPLEPSGNRPIIFDVGTIASGVTRTLKYQLVIGSGVTQGKYENTAWAQYSNGRIISNKDRQTVQIVLDPLFDLGTIIGKVFWDRNQTGAQDAPKKTDEEIEAETGIPNVQIVMEDGTVVTTDKDGKYHIQSIVPGRHLLRINERTLPDGAYLTTDKIVVIDTTPGLLSKVNFGVNSKDKGRKGTEKDKAPVKILQKEQKVRPLLNAGLYPSPVISYADKDFEVATLPNEYEFRIFTNYSLFIKRWKLEILDRDTKALVKGFNGTHLTLNEPVYWDGRDKNGRWLDPGRNYIYVLSVMDKTGRTDATKPKDLKVTGYEPKILDRSKAESQRLKEDWVASECRVNNLDTQNIKLSNKVVVVESKGGFEAAQEAIPGTKVRDTSQINIIVDEAPVPVVASAAAGEEFTQEIVVPEGEHKVTVEAVDKEGRQAQETQYIKDKDNYMLFVAMGDAKGGYTFQKGSIEPIMHDDKYRDGFWSEGKLAYYLKGKVLGKYLITSSLDTDRENKALFRNLDPNKYYPVYGDTSKVNYDATNTQGMLYLLVEWDKSSALWGNYNVNFKDTEFATFSRSLYGANVNYQDVSTTQFGEPNTKLVVFKATAKQQAAHNEFVGTGGSLFYLKNKDVIEGSEKVAIEVRDKVSGLVLTTLKQEEGFDYSVDYDNGRIIFWEPVSHIAESSSIVSSALLNGNPVYVVVDYEYKTLEKYDEGVYGVRAEQSITDYVRLGGTYIREDQQSKNYGLAGVDTTLHLGAETKITGEFAQSKSQELGRFISTDGGLTFAELLTGEKDSGRAYGVKGESHLFDKLGVSGYYKKIEKDFSSISTASQQGKQLIGAAVTYDITPKTRFTAKHDIQELLDDGNPQTQLQVGAKKTETTTAQITQSFDKLRLTGEYRHQKVEDRIEKYESETNENGDIVAARADYKLSAKTSLFAEQQASIKGSPNNQTTAGIDTKINEYLSLRGKETVGNRGNATSVGAFTNITDRFKLSGDYTIANDIELGRERTAAVTANAKVDDNSEIYNTYSMSSSPLDGKKNSSLFGAKKTLDNGLELSMEQKQASSKREVSDTDILGVSGNINDKLALTAKFERGVVQDFSGTRYNRNAPSLALSYADKDKIKASLKAEARFDRADEDKRQYLVYAAIEDKVNPDLTLFAKANVSNSANTTSGSTLAFYREFTLGTAYRPVNFDRLNLLARYNYFNNTAPSGQIDIKDVEGYKAHILSGEAAYDLTDHWQVIQKLALRIGEEKVTGFEFTKTQTWLTVSRLNYNINRDWQVGAEYRRLAQSQAKDAKQGALIELAKNIGEYVQAGVGYNFTDFEDDLTSLDYTSQGPFVRLTGKFFDRTPEEIERLRQKREEERIRQWVNELVDYELKDPDSEIAQELRHYYHVAERAQQEGKLQTAKRYYAKVIQAGNMMKQEADEYVRKRVELEKTLAKDDELARAYYKEGRLQEAKQLWEKIIKEAGADDYPAKW